MTDTLPPQEKVHGLMINADLSKGPFYIDGMDTTPKLFRLRARTLGARTAHREKTCGIWRSHSWADYFTHATHLGLGLVSLGLQRGEVEDVVTDRRRTAGRPTVGTIALGEDAEGQVVQGKGSLGVVRRVDPGADQVAHLKPGVPSNFFSMSVQQSM